MRQKAILIADRSEHGWATVAEYEEDELADNADDEKRLFRAEARAGRKLKQKGPREAKKKGGPAPKKPFRSSYAQSWAGQQAQSSGAASFASGVPILVPQFLGQGASRPPNTALGTSQLGPCFLCGKTGHYKKACPLLQSATFAKNT